MARQKRALYFYSDLYHQGYYFLFRWSREQVSKFIPGDFSSARGFAVPGEKDGAIYIWVEDGCEDEISCLVHECIHAANFTLGPRGIKVSAKQDEAHAYLTQWIFTNCFSVMGNKKKK